MTAHWQSRISGHDHKWHNGCRQPLPAAALAPGTTTYLGLSNSPLLIDGRRGAVSGGVWQADDPPLVGSGRTCTGALPVVCALRLVGGTGSPSRVLAFVGKG